MLGCSDLSGSNPPSTYTVTYDGNSSDNEEIPTDGNNYKEGETLTVAGPWTMAWTDHTGVDIVKYYKLSYTLLRWTL